jgi:ribosomal protein S18 acetylase RimI-like enzyme
VDPLDNVVWHALTGPQAPVALAHPSADPRAARFPPEMSVFAAMADEPTPDSWVALAALVGPEGVTVLFRDQVAVPSGWTELQSGQGIQMLGDEVVGRADPEAVELGQGDADEVLALIGRTQPGPFGPRTLELGRYVGVRRDGRLVAMAGERFRVPGWTEVSAVCTDADHRGQGLAGRLVLDVVAAIAARGDAALLHVAADNAGAARLYRSLGFRIRRQVEFRAVRAPAG